MSLVLGVDELEVGSGGECVGEGPVQEPGLRLEGNESGSQSDPVVVVGASIYLALEEDESFGWEGARPDMDSYDPEGPLWELDDIDRITPLIEVVLVTCIGEGVDRPIARGTSLVIFN